MNTCKRIKNKPVTIFGVVKNEKLYRLTFSRSLAEFISNNDYSVKRLKVLRGSRIFNITESKAKIFLICSICGKILRASLIKEIALIQVDNVSRFLYEGFVVK